MLSPQHQETIMLSLIAAFEMNGIELKENDYAELVQVTDNDLTDISFMILKILANHGYNRTNNKNMSFATGLKITGDFLNELVNLGLKGDCHEKETTNFNFRTIFDNWLCLNQSTAQASRIQH